MLVYIDIIFTVLPKITPLNYQWWL